MIDFLKQKSLFLLDMDGTLYHGEKPIFGATDFIDNLFNSGKEVVYMTNNSSKSADKYIEKLHRLGFAAKKENMFTSGQATAVYIKQNLPSARVFVMGTQALKDELSACGIEICENGADCVLCGYDTELTYEKITKACGFLCEGAAFLATNPDIVCPAENGRYLPDCHTMCDMLTAATGKTPFYIGKPRAEMALCAVADKNKTPSDAVIIGDRIYTDIKCGENAKITTVMVLSGESTHADIEKYGIHPDFVVNSVKDLI